MGKKVTVDLDKLKAALYDSYVQRFTDALTQSYTEDEDATKYDSAIIAGFLATDRVVNLMLELDESGGE